MDKLLEKILEVVDYSQEAKNNIDIVLFIRSNIKEIVEISKTIGSDNIELNIDNSINNYLRQLVEDELGIKLDDDTALKINNLLKQKG